MNNLQKFAEEILNEIELCRKDTVKKKEKGMPPGMDWKSEELGYKTCLCIVKRILEKYQSPQSSVETPHKKQNEDIFKGCGKRILFDNEDCICNEFHFCPECKARQEGYKLGRESIRNLIGELMDLSSDGSVKFLKKDIEKIFDKEEARE